MVLGEFETEMKNEIYDTFVHGIVSNTSNSGPFVQELLDYRHYIWFLAEAKQDLDIKAEKVNSRGSKSEKEGVQGEALSHRSFCPLYVTVNHSLKKRKELL